MRGPRSGRKDPAAGRRRCGGASVLYGSGVTGGEQQGVARWGGAPTGARPAKTAVKRRGGGASRPGRVRHQSPATNEGIGAEPPPWRVHPQPQAARLDRREKGGAYFLRHQPVLARFANWEAITSSNSIREFDHHATCVVAKYE